MNLSSQSRVVKPRYILLYCCSRFLSLKPPHHSKDHYKTLGIPRNATTKEIKIAFYELSKKHHPDMNPDNKVEAAQKFQNLSEAYEVLTSDEKRRIYDSLSMPSNSKSSKYYGRTVEQSRGTKEWSDLDIDYKDFEHFQRLNRRKRAFHRSAGNTTDAFWAAHHGYSENYKNNRALEREMLERQLEAELEEIKRRTAHPMPTFEQLIRQEEERIRKEKKRINIMMFGAVPFITMIFVIISFRM